MKEVNVISIFALLVSILIMAVNYYNGRRQVKIAKLEEILSILFFFKSVYISLDYYSSEVIRYGKDNRKITENENLNREIDEFLLITDPKEFTNKSAKLNILIHAYCSNKKKYKKLALTLNDMVIRMYAILRYKDYMMGDRYSETGFLRHDEFIRGYEYILKGIIKDMDLGHRPIGDNDIINFTKKELYKYVKK